jgi:hypothetical protein
MLNPPSSQKSPQLPLGRDAMTSHPLYDIHSQVPGLGHQAPGSGIQHQVQVQDPHPHPYPYPNLKARTRYPTAET